MRKTAFGYLSSAMLGAVIGGLIMALVLSSTYPAVMMSESTPTEVTLLSVASSDVSPAVYVAEQLGPCVTGVTSTQVLRDRFGRVFERESYGSGFLVSQDGYIVTNYHVVQAADEIHVTLWDNRVYAARLVGEDVRYDLAVLKIDAEALPYAKLGDSLGLRTGETVIAIGNPVGSEFQRSVTQGIVSGLGRIVEVEGQSMELIQTDAVINPGNSGGPLADTRGHVVGINTMKISLPRVEGMGFAVPIHTVEQQIREIMQKDRPGGALRVTTY